MTAPLADTSVRRLAPSIARFYREFVQKQPFGLAVLHLQDPHDTSTWELIACNRIAQRVAGSTVESYLSFPNLEVAGSDMPIDIAAAYRGVVWYGRVAWLGSMPEAARVLPHETYGLEVYPYPHNCAGVVFEAQSGLFRSHGVVNITDQKTAKVDARTMSLRVMKAQEQERKRISRELHDSVGQYLTGIHWNLAKLRREGAHGDTLDQKLGECVDLVKSCMEELRSVAYALQPPVLEMLGLGAALEWQGKRFSEQNALKIQLEVPEKAERYGGDTELTLFRVFQECLSNVRRHANTDSARVKLSANSRSVTLEVRDGGVGMPQDPGHHSRGIGLLKMRERVGELGGTLEIVSNGRGTVVRARVPRSPDSESGRPSAVASVAQRVDPRGADEKINKAVARGSVGG